MQRNRGFVSSRVSGWVGNRPFQRGNVPVPLFIEYLVVAGGGGGSNYTGIAGGRPGAGAGGLIWSGDDSEFLVSRNTLYSVTVGAGGAGSTSEVINSDGSQGINSSVFSQVAIGGGFSVAGSGGSGGGGALETASNSNDSQNPVGTGTFGQGNSGGIARNGLANEGRGGGGGGAGAAGESGRVSGNGGIGRQINIIGQNVYYAGGGGGNAHPGSSAGFVGLGGQGGGADGIVTGNGKNGLANTGGGASSGGVSSGNIGGNGGSGVVILRYPNTTIITIGAGLTGTTADVGSDKVTTITAGTGNVSWSL
jgi:hypothetical protein